MVPGPGTSRRVGPLTRPRRGGGPRPGTVPGRSLATRRVGTPGPGPGHRVTVNSPGKRPDSLSADDRPPAAQESDRAGDRLMPGPPGTTVAGRPGRSEPRARIGEPESDPSDRADRRTVTGPWCRTVPGLERWQP
eukprot:765732-Hanusia_phi.AAC.2